MNKAIFWDFDGTLGYSPSIWSRSVFKVLMETDMNCGADFEQVRVYMKTGFTWHTPERDYSNTKDELWWEFHFKHFEFIFSEYGIDKVDAHKAVRKIRDEILNPVHYSLYEDTVFILEKSIQKGYRNYIVSNNFPELDEILKALGIAKYFDDTIISAKIGYDKPRPELFEYALKLADYPEACLMVGDNPVADIEGAKNVGMTTVLVHNNTDCGADYCFNTLIEIANIL